MSDPNRVREQLLGYALEARKKGLVIVCDAFDITEGEYKRGGVCALGAYEAMAERDARLDLPDGEELSSAWDAIEHGFDGLSRRPEWPFEWWRVGVRLREELCPVPAARLLARDPQPKIRFT